MSRPSHGRLAFEVVIGSNRFETFVHLRYQISCRQILNVFDSIYTETVEIVSFQPPQCIINELLRSITNLPIHIRHVRRKLAI